MACMIYEEQQFYRREGNLQSTMDRKEKTLKLLGAFGIAGEAFKIIGSQAELLGVITLVFILPLTLISMAHSLMVPMFLDKMIISVQSTEGWRLPVKQLMVFSVLEIVYTLFLYAALMPSMAAVVYTVGNVYTGNQKPSFARVVGLALAVWKRMMKTWLWYFTINFAIAMAFGFTVCFLAVGFVVFDKWYVVAFYVALIVACVVLFLVSVYVEIVWQVANVMSVMEEEEPYGLEGMKKSRRLLEGKRTTAWVVNISFLVINGVLGYAVVKWNMNVVGVGPKIAYGTAFVMMACVLGLLGMLTQSVLYFVCKSYHRENIDGYEAINNKEMESLEP